MFNSLAKCKFRPRRITMAGMTSSHFLTLELTIARASVLSDRLQLLISNEREHVVKTNCDNLVLMYWTILFEYHQGILTLLRSSNPTSAFALLRVFEESYLKLFIAMFGTEKQFNALRAGTYQTEFEVVGKQIDDRLGAQPLFAKLFKDKIKVLHGFTHSGREQLSRQLRKNSSGGLDVVTNYSEDEARALVQETMPTIFLAAAFITEFLDYPVEHQTAVGIFNEYIGTERMALQVEEMSSKIPEHLKS